MEKVQQSLYDAELLHQEHIHSKQDILTHIKQLDYILMDLQQLLKQHIEQNMLSTLLFGKQSMLKIIKMLEIYATKHNIADNSLLLMKNYLNKLLKRFNTQEIDLKKNIKKYQQDLIQINSNIKEICHELGTVETTKGGTPMETTETAGTTADPKKKKKKKKKNEFEPWNNRFHIDAEKSILRSPIKATLPF